MQKEPTVKKKKSHHFELRWNWNDLLSEGYFNEIKGQALDGEEILTIWFKTDKQTRGAKPKQTQTKI